jgi:hypothetical protein
MTAPALSNHLADGYNDGRPGETASLEEAGREWNDESDTGYRATSVLSQRQLSPMNGRSESAAQRVLPWQSAGPVDAAMMPSGNATSEATNEDQTAMRVSGALPPP